MLGRTGSRRPAWPLGRVAVAGASMLPTLHPGDWLVVRWGAHVRPGDVVVARRPDRPGLLLVKRVVRREPGGWWLVGDNPGASDDSRLFGPVADDLVLGRVLGRYWPLGRRRVFPV
ncbi:MAG TPA: nickel-type superoxide dismutase maturation protease [Actinomycetes bacterium]|nr:nickel-type superoxide dismutase maturation protease [Actinomycetes bacterium]